MAVALGTLEATILVQIGDGTPTPLGDFTIPITVRATRFTNLGSITVDEVALGDNIADALEAGARSLRQTVR